MKGKERKEEGKRKKKGVGWDKQKEKNIEKKEMRRNE